MADIYQTGPEGHGAGGTFARATQIAGALTSLALIVGLGVWGTKLIMRDVTGIPVVEAIEGPMRVAPDRPGGTLADHQGLAVNDVAGRGVAAPAADTLRLAPPPVALEEEDVATADLETIAPQAAPVPEATSEEPPAMLAEGQPDAEADPEVNATLAVLALADRIAEGSDPLSPLSPPAVAEAPLSDVTEAGFVASDETAEPIAASLEVETSDDSLAGLDNDEDTNLAVQLALAEALGQGGVIQSVRPRQRPAEGVQLAAAGPLDTPLVSPARAESVAEIAPESIPAGTRLVQLGAFDSPEIARAEWARLGTRFEEYLAGKARVIEKASSGGKTFYRLRAHGFTDLSDARRFCAALVAGRADCIPVAAR